MSINNPSQHNSAMEKLDDFKRKDKTKLTQRERRDYLNLVRDVNRYEQSLAPKRIKIT